MPQDALQSILTEAGLALAPVRAINSGQKAQDFFKKLGYDIPVNAFGSALGAMATQGTELVTAVRTLVDAEGDTEVIAALAAIAARFTAFVAAIVDLHNQVKATGGAGIPNIDQFPRRLTDFLILEYLETQKAQLHDALYLFGLIEVNAEAAAGTPTRLINWDRFGLVFTNPRQLFNDVYQWETDFDAAKFLSRLERLMKSTALPGGLYPQAATTKTILGNASNDHKELRFPFFQKGLTPQTYAQFGITFAPAEAQGGKKKGIALLPYIMGSANFDFNVCDRGELVFQSSADIKGVGFVLRPPFNAEGILNFTANYNASIAIREKADKTEEIILVGSRNGTRFALKGLGVKWFIGNSGGKLDLGMEGEIQVIRLVISGGDGDGFLQKMLSGVNIQIDSNVAFKFSLLHGFSISGGAQFTIDLPVHIELGPVAINGLKIGIAPAADKFKLDAGANLKLSLGPIVAVVENIGLRTELEFKQGNIGPANLNFAFKPPTGIGLSIDAGVVKGGGYILFDVDNQQYAGALELSILDTIQVAAICVITTKMPDGSPGFSLLIIISVTFSPGISLSMGFFLSGLGGMLGINRTINVDALREGVKNNAIDHILFPENIIENITTIIQQITTIFPPKKDQFMIGLMARITWGVPALITIDFGIIIEFASPTRIAILGVVKIALPTEEAAILQLQVNFVGIIDFEKGMLSFDASLYNSRILTFTLEGDMALRLGWGETKGFLLSVGGFHPQFTPPANLKVPSMKRLTLTILADNPRLVLTCYFAVTSNTVQFGAKIDFRFAVSEFKVVGYLYFDALFQFSPFRFIVGIGAGLEVKIGDCTLFAITLDFELAGPTPWNAKGTASFSILFFTIKVRFDEEWGEKNSIQYPKIAVLPKAMEALQLDSNWTTELPSNKSTLVSTRDIPSEPGNIVLQPFGSFKVSQTILPIAQVLDKFGDNLPADIKKIDITQVKIGNNVVTGKYPTESFAPAMFKKLDEKQKLKAPSYEEMKSGVKVTETDEITVLSRANRKVEYEVHVSDFDPTPETPLFTFDQSLFKMMIKGGAIGNSALSREYAAKKAVKKDAAVSLNDEAFVMMNKGTMDSVAHNGFSGGSFSDATDALNDYVRANPSMKGKVKIVPAYHMEME